MNSIWSSPVFLGALNAACVAFFLYVQSYFQEKRRKVATTEARKEVAEATSTKVIEKLLSGRASPMPSSPVPYPTDPAIRIANEAPNVTPAETPDAKRGSDK